MSFLTPLYLWFLPLVTIPVLIYLFNRSKYKDKVFSSIRFLSFLNKKTIKKINLVNILLIIIRTLIVLTFILMMSRPIYNSSYNLRLIEDTVILIGVDNSLSMKINEDKIKSHISTIAESSNPNTNIVIFKTEDFSIIYDKDIKSLRTNNLKFDTNLFYNDENEIDTFLSKYNTYINKHFFLISDGQSNLLERYKNLDKEWIINYINIKNDTANLSIINMESNKDIVLSNDIFKIKVSVRNNGYINYKNQLIELYVNNINLGKKYFDIKANSIENIYFDLIIPEYGEHLCYAKLEYDEINEDNIFYSVLNLKENIGIDIIDSENNIFLKNIFESFNLNKTIVKTNFYTANSYLSNSNQNNILFINGLLNITDEIKSKINETLKYKNINVIIFPTIKDKSLKNISKLLPKYDFSNSLRKTIGNNQYLEVDNKSIKTKKFNDIFSNSSYRNIKVFDYISSPSDSNTYLSFNNNDSFLKIYKPSSNTNSEIKVSTISLDLNSSNLALKGNILPFFSSLIMDYRLIEFFDQNNISTLTSSLNDNNVLITPSNQKFIFISNNDKEAFNELGFYKIESGLNKNNFSINIDSYELKSNFLNEKEILKLLPENSSILNSTNETLNAISNFKTNYDLWKFAFLLLVILIALEMYLSSSMIKND